MHPTDVASAAWVFAAAPSKAPLYVAGSLLACWAVLLAATGITHPGFPGSAARARLVMLASALLVATTLTAAVVTGGPSEQTRAQAGPSPASGGSGASNTLQLAADPTGQLAYDKKSATVKAGRVAIRFVNKSPVPHNVTIALGARTAAATSTIQGGASAAAASLQPGRYVFYCSVDAHRQAGMQGTLTVR
jgi:plastocyanin